MGKIQLRFSFDYGCCIWGDDGGIDPEKLPISKDLVRKLDALNDEFYTSLNWSSPLDPSPWTKEEFVDFFNRAELVYETLKNELEAGYSMINQLDRNRHMYMDDRVFAPTLT